MTDTLLIIFVKNIILGKVKTRLAERIGTQGAFEVYKHIVEMTEKVTSAMNTDIRVYFSDVIIHDKWPNHPKFVQQGEDLGERMHHAFVTGFEDGYRRVVLIGSDLPDISAPILEEAFHQLQSSPIVFGPAEDGGYYLVALTQPTECIFQNKQWSTSSLLETTLAELQERGHAYQLLGVLNDVDTLEDLKTSSIAASFSHFWE